VGYALVSAMFCLLLGYPVAYYIAHRGEVMQKFLYMLVMLPMCMSFLLRTLAWVGLLQDTGIINNFLEWIGIGRLRLIRTPAAVILGMVYNYLPYMILPLYTIMVKIDQSVVEAAQDLGCNTLQMTAKVLLPLSVPGIVAGITMVFVPSVSTFIISRMLGGGNNLMMGDLIEMQFLGNSLNYNLGSAMSLVLMVVVLICMSVTHVLGNEDVEEVM
jgi:spermidine/putrescine transport system permease protein